MANVYRRGTKSVHIGWPGGPGVPVATVAECNLDPGGSWGPAIPPGPRCEACFGPPHLARDRRGLGRSKAVVAATAGSLALAAIVFASSLEEPVTIFPPFATNAATYSPTAPLPSVTPEPTLAPPTTPVPVLTFPPLPTFGPLPTFPPIPTYPPVPTFGPLPPLPTLGPLPSLSLPCVHPGEHVGVVDICKWPGNR